MDTNKKHNQSQVVLYQTADGKMTVDVLFARENFWLTQKAMTELFGVKTPAVSRHLKNIFKSGELVEDSVVSILETTAADGKSYATRYYNLDAAIAVGYLVNSVKAHEEFEKFWVKQDQQYISDFDAAFARYLKGGEKP